MKYVIIGSGVAAFEAANTIRTQDELATIEIYTKELVRPYRRPALSKLLCSEVVENQFYIKPNTFFAEKNIALFHNHELYNIDREAKVVKFTNEITTSYDKLLLALGGESFIPPISGVELDGVCVLRNYADLLFIRSKLQPSSHIVVVGGGILGLELAESLTTANYKISLVEGLDRLLPRLLNEQESTEFAEQIAQNYNINLHIGSFPQSIGGKEQVEYLELANKSIINCDMVIFSAGVRPNIVVAEASGLEVSKFGITVDKYLKTNDPNIYAAGDCVSFDNAPAAGLYLPARDMGICAGKNILGNNIEYIPKSYPVRMQALGLKTSK